MAGGASSLDGKLVVAAIDFGTAYSGYAFSFRNNFRLNPLDIDVNQWSGEDALTMSSKAPSSVLLSPDKAFHSFGYEAEEEYSSLVENEQHQDWYFFRNIKMRLLYKEKLSRSDTICDECDKPMPGITILSMIIRHLKAVLFKSLEKRGFPPREEDILWVLTVPAIWSDAAKQFTKEAAEEAGIQTRDLMFVYEPEAAALYCWQQKLQQKLTNINAKEDMTENKERATFSIGQKILVFDMGGGTTDISVIQIKSEKEIHIVEEATGGPFGGTSINEKFCQWLDDVFGKDNMQKFKHENMSDHMQFIREFEQKKRKSEKPLCLQIPLSLKLIAEKSWECKLEDRFEKSDVAFPGIKVKARGKLFLPSSFLSGNLILPLAKNVFAEMERIFKKHSDITSVIAVGGLAQSVVMTSELRKYAKTIPVYVPFDSSVAVLKGAVLYGHENNVIKARVCKCSYGIQTMRPFEEKEDDPRKKVNQEGETWCKECFRVLYRKGSMIKLGDVSSYELEESFHDENRKEKRFKPIRCVLFRSDSETVQRYVTEKGCYEHGTIEIDAPEDGFPLSYECTVELEFAGTEIIARLKDKERTKTLRLDFIN
ncbi:heat shock 70 kDa protein 12A-like [Saccostrea echinata]|uniref:heat shock 70 kDa protein 12A-like n=1 Tax=Saccostrea echinata TaxID=191078 RepID=UPI002A8264CE|nr:heat shock 70 kDa protein 12A-like [Saccostrea echinata]